MGLRQGAAAKEIHINMHIDSCCIYFEECATHFARFQLAVLTGVHRLAALKLLLVSMQLSNYLPFFTTSLSLESKKSFSRFASGQDIYKHGPG